MLELMPALSKIRLLRQWAGLCDMTPDFSPIMGRTPVDGFYVDIGWGTYGFKAGPASGEAMAECVAGGRTPEIICGIRVGPVRLGRAVGREGRGGGGPLMIALPCPWCGPRNVTEFRYVGEVTSRPDPGSTTREQWRGYLYLRRNPHDVVEESWYHTAGYRRFFQLHRDTGTNTVTERR